nr:unnamed protein product [Callosobruchus chinensis]
MYIFLLESHNFSAALLTPGHECVRECKDGEPPKFCYYKFTLELYETLGAACDVCQPNDMFAPRCSCILADGFERTLLSINKMLPGPSIQVCAGDRIVVDVTNAMDGYEATLHWHGLRQLNTQYYDGVPMITQCPINGGQTFRYQMISTMGTYFYHAHTGLQKFEGLSGSVIGRLPRCKDSLSQYFDHDLPEHVVFVSDWLHMHIEDKFPGLRTRIIGQDPESLLINGKGRWTDRETGNTTTTPLEIFNVKKGYRYRFRMINAMTSSCTMGMRVLGHKLTVISTDGEAVIPKVVDTIYSAAGERYDFVINATEDAQQYWMQFWSDGLCYNKSIQQLAILNYEGANSTSLTSTPTFDQAADNPGFSLNDPTVDCTNESPSGICMTSLKSGYSIDDKDLLKEKPDIKLYINFTFTTFRPEELFKPGTNRKYAVLLAESYSQAFVNGFSFAMPPSPLISQYQDAKTNLCPTNGQNPEGCTGNCSCTNVIKVPLNAVVEVVLIDGVTFDDVHSFHLHGYSFKVLGMGTPADLNITAANTTIIKALDEQGLLER